MFQKNFMTDKDSTKKSADQDKENKNIAAAEDAAEHDIDTDPELSMKPEAGDDLDEGELARFESDDEEEEE